MGMNGIIKHQSKEIIKNMVNNTRGYTEKTKYELMMLREN